MFSHVVPQQKEGFWPAEPQAWATAGFQAASRGKGPIKRKAAKNGGTRQKIERKPKNAHACILSFPNGRRYYSSSVLYSSGI